MLRPIDSLLLPARIGLVEHKYGWLVHDRLGEADPLSVALGQGRNPLVPDVVKARARQRLCDLIRTNAREHVL